jgi:hypothetical protein
LIQGRFTIHADTGGFTAVKLLRAFQGKQRKCPTPTLMRANMATA